MRILFTKRTFAPMGGSESLAYQFATRLAVRGHDVRVVCTQAFDERARFTTRSGVDVVQVKPRGGIFGLVVDASTLVDLMPTPELERHAGDRDLIHNVGREYLDSSLRVSEALDVPVVLTPLAHPGQFHGGDLPSDFERYRRASAITTMTEWERGWYASWGIDPYRVVTTGMGPNATRSSDGHNFRRRHRIPADAPVVLYVGRRERYKGFIHLLDAAERVWQRHRETRFVFIGLAGFYGSVVDEFARHTDERIIAIDRATSAETAAAFDACSLYAMPSLHETFGIGYLEAWMAGLPVIAGDIAPLREVVREDIDGLHVRNEPGAVAEAILALLRDAERARRMGANGRARVLAQFTWPAVAKRTISAYELARTRSRAAARE